MTRLQRLHAAVFVTVVAAGLVALWGVPEFRYFYGWPSGVAIGNYAADGLVLVLAGWGGAVFRAPLARLWHRIRTSTQAETHAALAEIRATAARAEHHAAAARQIAADTHQQITGHDHPAAP